jgi:hypothetical protein
LIRILLPVRTKIYEETNRGTGVFQADPMA